MAAEYEVTIEGASPAKDRAHRIRVYFIAMTIRVLCVVSLFWLRGWWIAVAAAGAVLLPYFAVLIANQAAAPGTGAPESPTPPALQSGSDSTDRRPASEEVLIVDAPMEITGHADEPDESEEGRA